MAEQRRRFAATRPTLAGNLLLIFLLAAMVGGCPDSSGPGSRREARYMDEYDVGRVGDPRAWGTAAARGKRAESMLLSGLRQSIISTSRSTRSAIQRKVVSDDD